MRYSSNPTPTKIEVDDRRGLLRDDTEERRVEDRQRTMLSGVVVFPGEETGRPVAILNRAKGGAKLRLGDVGLLPRTFTLLDQRAGLAHVCRVVWRAMPFVGVHYEKTVDLNTVDDKGMTRQLKNLWDATKS